MDPNENLKLQLEAARRILRGSEDDAAELAELVIALNEWIERGGFLPEKWSKKK